jgi:hypothetical protein
MGKPLVAIQAILRHKSPATTERYLRSWGLEETRSHLEDLCEMEPPPVNEGERAVQEAGNEKPAQVINFADHLEKRSQAV